MPAVTILLYRERDEVPLLAWLDGMRNDRARVWCIEAIEQLAAQGHEARRPLAAPLRDGIYELRVRVGREQYRMLYCFYGRNAVVLTHGLVKEREEVPDAEIERALHRKERFEADPESHACEF